MTKEDRKAALEWWRNLTDNERAEIHTKSDKSEWSYFLFSASSEAITRAWLKLIPKEIKE